MDKQKNLNKVRKYFLKKLHLYLAMYNFILLLMFFISFYGTQLYS